MIGEFLNWIQHVWGKGPTPDGQSFSELLLGALNFWSLLEGTHLIVLMLFAGTIMVVDLRLLGVIFRKTKVSTISDAILPLTVYSFVFVVISGVGLLFAKPIFYYTRGGICWYPHVKGLTVMVNSIFNGWRMEEVWLDK